jgi:hypothetical protein
MKELKVIFIIAIICCVIFLIGYIEMMSGIPADICFIPNLFIGFSLGMYAIYRIVNVIES